MEFKTGLRTNSVPRVATDLMIKASKAVTDQELSDAKDYLIGSFPLRLDTNRRVASFLVQVEFYQLDLDYAERYGDLIRNVTREDVERVARQYLHPEKLITVVVGDQKKIGEN